MNSPLQITFSIHPRPCGQLRQAAASAAHTQPGRLPRATEILALAVEFEGLIERGDVHNYAGLACRFGLSRERISQIVHLNFLAPDIQMELLYLPPTPSGRYPISEAALRRIARELSWTAQRERWNALKTFHRLNTSE